MTEFCRVVIGHEDPQGLASLYQAITGGVLDDGGTCVSFAGAEIAVVEGGRGVVRVEFGDVDLEAAEARMTQASVSFGATSNGLEVAPDSANGVAVRLVADELQKSNAGTAALDHVAVQVRDLAVSSEAWSAMLGVEAHQMGIHPVSNGDFMAARLLLGERMIELVSPTPGVASKFAEGLEQRGEGASTLALPVRDLDTVMRALEDRGVRLLEMPPHWMVHPKSAGGVLAQLTPRVQH